MRTGPTGRTRDERGRFTRLDYDTERAAHVGPLDETRMPHPGYSDYSDYGPVCATCGTGLLCEGDRCPICSEASSCFGMVIAAVIVIVLACIGYALR